MVDWALLIEPTIESISPFLENPRKNARNSISTMAKRKIHKIYISFDSKGHSSVKTVISWNIMPTCWDETNIEKFSTFCQANKNDNQKILRIQTNGENKNLVFFFAFRMEFIDISLGSTVADAHIPSYRSALNLPPEYSVQTCITVFWTNAGAAKNQILMKL